MHWRLKALAFRALELPGGDALHYLLQRRLLRSWPRQAKGLDASLAVASRVVDHYCDHVGGTPLSVLEIGAGRDLAVPLALRRLGVGHVIASDIKRLARIDLIQHAARHLCDFVPATWDDLERAGISYRAPCNLTEIDTPVDVTCSNEVLEHVPAGQLPELLSSLRAITNRLTVHSIDYSDHYARSDPSLSRLNFLRYSDSDWRRFNSGKQYVNRLRHSDYVDLFRNAGFTILRQTSTTIRPPDNFRIASHFKQYEPADLFAIRGVIVAR